MRLNREEQDIIIYFADQLKANPTDNVTRAQLLSDLSLTDRQLDHAIDALWTYRGQAFEISYDSKTFIPMPGCIHLSREIQASRRDQARPRDLVATFEQWVRSKPAGAAIILAVKVLAVLFTLIGATLGIIAYFRG